MMQSKNHNLHMNMSHRQATLDGQTFQVRVWGNDYFICQILSSDILLNNQCRQKSFGLIIFKYYNLQMYGKLHERKLNENDYIMSCQKARDQLNHYLDQQSKRVNVDSAKKRAVVQHMDYEGFRQMVLGANIFPTKSKQIYNFSKGQTNKEMSLDKEIINEEKPRKSMEEKLILQKIQGKSQMHCVSFREFKKKFNQKYSKQFEEAKTLYCYNLLKEQNEERIQKIFNTDCEGNILLKIVNVFEQVLGVMSNNKTEGVEEQALFMLFFFKTLAKIPTMKSMTLMILSKKEKTVLGNFLLGLKQLLKQEQEIQEIEKVYTAFSQ